MNTDTQASGQRRIAREDCEVGDWVDPMVAPEWSEEEPSHVFRREQISISPVDGGMGGILPDQSGEWTFVAQRRPEGLAWVRQS